MSSKTTPVHQHNLLHVLLFCLILLAVVLLLVSGQTENDYSQVSEASPVAEAADDNLQESIAVHDAPPPQDIVVNYKTCQTTGGSITIPTTDKCPEDLQHMGSELVEEVEEPPVSEEPQPQTQLTQPTVGLKQYFTFSNDLKLRVDSFVCRPVREVIAADKSLATIRSNYQKYKDESLSLLERLQADGSILYDYIDSFDRYLIDGQVKQAADDVMEYFAAYQECELRLTAQNTGFGRTLADGCGLSFAQNVSLVDDKGESIGPHGFRQILCTRNTVEFTFGATDGDRQYFILKATAEVDSIIIDNHLRDGIEAVISSF